MESEGNCSSDDETATVRIIASARTWIEGEAVRQLEQTAELPGMRAAVGMPDLHPGKGHPIGAAFVSEGRFYPYLVGNDIGCGMGLWATSLKRKKIKRDRWVRKLHGMEGPWNGRILAWLESHGAEPSRQFDESLGTIGGGNHFAELQQVEEVYDKEALASIGIEADRLVLLVHSGSRGWGHHILRAHVDKHRAGALEAGTKEAQAYLENHDKAVRWASANRALIAHRFLSALGSDGDRVLDLCHNSVTCREVEGCTCWLHRKGAAPSDEGLVVIPGSRGSWSYVLEPVGDQAEAAWSLAHGAGRKWARSEAKQRLQKYRRDDLLQTDLGSSVICEDKSLLYEEAPMAYKNIDHIIEDMVEAKLVRLVARLRPIITYKTRAR